MKILFAIFKQNYIDKGKERVFKQLGHEVKVFEYAKIERGKYPVPLLYQAIVQNSNNEFKRTVITFRPDVILVEKGETIFPSTITWIKKNFRIPCILRAPDDPQLFDRFSRYIAPVYDYVFTSSVDVIPKYKELGVQKVSYLPFTFNPSLHKIVKLSPEEKKKYGIDICFVGKFYPEREKILKYLLDHNLKIYGKNWHFSDMEVCKKWTGKQIFGPELVKLYNASKIVLNIHDNQMKYGGMKANLRVFEVTGCGAFLLTDKPKGIEDLFRPDIEIVCYQSKKELLELVDYYLENPKERKKIAKAGQKRAYKDHTPMQRCKKILSVINQI